MNEGSHDIYNSIVTLLHVFRSTITIKDMAVHENVSPASCFFSLSKLTALRRNVRDS